MSVAFANSAVPLSNDELANMLFVATQEVFTSMLGSDIRQLSQSESTATESFDGILSLVGLAGAVIGNGAFVCNAATACGLSSRLLCAESTSLDDQVLDSVGEITNMVIGGFKNLLEPHTGDLKMSIPTVVYGKNIATRNAKADVAVSVRCGFADGEFELTVRLARGHGR